MPKTDNKKSQTVLDKDKVQALIDKGEPRGFVTFSEILQKFPDIEEDITGLEELYSRLEQKGIEVKRKEGYLDVNGDAKEKAKKASKKKIDPVQMYLKEIGKVPFLSAEE